MVLDHEHDRKILVITDGSLLLFSLLGKFLDFVLDFLLIMYYIMEEKELGYG